MQAPPAALALTEKQWLGQVRELAELLGWATLSPVAVDSQPARLA
ncbi:MAG: hypothetical protein ACRDGJ_04875 [Candidatus Limnocylindria bacterium]